jgi:hypothetical protein
MPRDELKKLLKEVRQTEQVPDFQKVWHQAEAMESKRVQNTPLSRRMLVPVAVAAGIAVLTVVGIQVGTDQNNQNLPVETVQNPLESPALLKEIEPWMGNLDGLGTEWTFELTSLERLSDDEVDMSVVSFSDSTPGDDMYESQTDFLLDLEIPAWNRSEERNVL